MNRRQLFKYSGLLSANLIFSPDLVWSGSLTESNRVGEKFILKNKNISEYSPGLNPKLSTLKARLHWNENPFGPSKEVLKSFKNNAKRGNFYSWDIHSELINLIAIKEGVKSNNIITGPGSSDLLEKTAIVLLRNGGTVISADPCYMSLINVALSSKPNNCSRLTKVCTEEFISL